MPPTIAYEPASKRLLTLYEASRITCSTVTAIGYVRRSKESGERTVSLEDQRARIAAYCAERGWLLAEILADDGVSGGNRERLATILERYRRSLYPDNVKIDLAATSRVADAHKAAGLLAPSVDYKPLLDLSIVGS